MQWKDNWKFAAEAMLQWHNMTFDAVFNIFHTSSCIFQETLKSNNLIVKRKQHKQLSNK